MWKFVFITLSLLIMLCFSVFFVGCGDNKNVPTESNEQPTEISDDDSKEENTDIGKDESGNTDGKQDGSDKKESGTDDSSGGITLPEIDFD